MPAPIVALFPLQATFTATAPTPINPDLGTVTVSESTTVLTDSAAPITSVSELTPNSSFGGDIVNITPGPGGVFGSEVYAISRGAGGNAGAINRPGVIYRVNPATGKASVFFDLNTVLSQTDPNNTSTTTPAANSMGASTGLVNWYSMTFDPEGTFDGTPSLFVSSVDRSDPAKNIIFQISPSGSLIGVFVQMTDGLASQKFNLNPTAILIPPVQDQRFLSQILNGTSGSSGGMIAGSGISSTGGTFAALYFNASQYSPGQVISNAALPNGVTQTALGLPVVATTLQPTITSYVFSAVNTGPIVGLTASNASYGNQIFSVFTDFGTPAGGGIPARPGYSGVQGSDGEALVGALGGAVAGTTIAAPGSVDTVPAVSTPFRRFYGVAFDQFGYFSQGIPLTSASTTTSGTTLTLGSGAPLYAGSLFVSDLASGLYVQVTPVSPFPTAPIFVPVQGSGVIGVTTDASGNVMPITSNGNTTRGSNNFGGRILRIQPNGTTTVFAYGFNTSGAQDASSFVNSTLSIGFSSDGTILYAADDDGIWQFKTTADLADSTSGSLIGLSDLRALGVPYDGQNAAVAVVDTGVDSQSTSFRGRVASGTNVTTGGLGNRDLAGSGTSSGATGGTGGTGGNGGTGGTGAGGVANAVISNTIYGHGTPVAGVVAQFVPDATIQPIDVFSPFWAGGTLAVGGTGATGGGVGGGGTGGTGGGTTTGTGGTIVTNNPGATAQTLYDGLQYLIQHPFVNDPIRGGQVDRVIAAVYAFGTPFTYQSEAQAYKQFPQFVVSLKNEYHKLRKEGVANIAASGELGAPLFAGASSSGGTTGTAATTTTLRADNNAENAAVGDVKGISLPAVINEVISVTGVYSFPFTLTPSTSPIDTPTGVIPQPLGPILLFGPSLTIGGTASSGTTGGTGGTTVTNGNNVNTLAAADINIWVDRIPGSVNRNSTTDFAAPAFNVPTFSRTYSAAASSSAATGGTGGTTGTGTGSTTTGGAFVSNPLAFNVVGTSMSSAIVTGSYALVSSALNYWTGLAQSNGFTADAYLNSPVGTNTLNFGKHAFKNLGAWNTPDGINAILAWTAVPATDVNDINTVSTPYTLPNSTAYSSYARVSVGNAIASIEGNEAINYLNKHHDWGAIDTNHDGLVTAQELQTFTDNASSMGMPEAGAMAALLGGTATYGPVLAGVNNTVFNENPDQPGAEQRRFNYFDYAADGQLNGSISINELKMLGRTLLPSPDAYTIIDRQRASANGFLLAPSTPRNFVAIKNLKPSFLWIPKSTVARYRHLSPTQLSVGYNQKGFTYLPTFTLFSPTVSTNTSTTATTQTQNVGLTKSANVSGSRVTVDYMVYTQTPTASPSPTSTTSSSSSSGATSGTGTTATSSSGTQATGSTHQNTGTTTTPSASGTATTPSATPTAPTQSTQTPTTPIPASTVAAVLSSLMPAGTETPVTSSSASAGTGTTATATSSGSSGTGTTSTGTSSSGSSGTGASSSPTSDPGSTTPNSATQTSTDPVPGTSAGGTTTTPTPTSTTTPTPTPSPTSSSPVSQVPLAYSSSSAPTIAVSPTPTAAAQAQRTPKAERVAVQRYVKAHKKQSSIDKFWSSVKKSLDIK